MYAPFTGRVVEPRLSDWSRVRIDSMATSKASALILVRASPNEWDASGRLCGSADLPLLPSAIGSLREAIIRIGMPVSRVVAGPGEACKTVSALIHDIHGSTVRLAADLHEVSIGLWEGMLACGCEHRFAAAFKQWKIDPASVYPPEGESYADAQSRLMSEVAKASARLKGGTALGVVLRPIAWAIVVATLEGRPATELWDIMASPDLVRPVVVPGATLKAHRPAVIRMFL